MVVLSRLFIIKQKHQNLLNQKVVGLKIQELPVPFNLFWLGDFFLTDLTMGFQSLWKTTIWENMFGSLFPSASNKKTPNPSSKRTNNTSHGFPEELNNCHFGVGQIHGKQHQVPPRLVGFPGRLIWNKFHMGGWASSTFTLVYLHRVEEMCLLHGDWKRTSFQSGSKC